MNGAFLTNRPATMALTPLAWGKQRIELAATNFHLLQSLTLCRVGSKLERRVLSRAAIGRMDVPSLFRQTSSGTQKEMAAARFVTVNHGSKIKPDSERARSDPRRLSYAQAKAAKPQRSRILERSSRGFDATARVPHCPRRLLQWS
jgi:hypothetical protein